MRANRAKPLRWCWKMLEAYHGCKLEVPHVHFAEIPLIPDFPGSLHLPDKKTKSEGQTVFSCFFHIDFHGHPTSWTLSVLWVLRSLPHVLKVGVEIQQETSPGTGKMPKTALFSVQHTVQENIIAQKAKRQIRHKTARVCVLNRWVSLRTGPCLMKPDPDSFAHQEQHAKSCKYYSKLASKYSNLYIWWMNVMNWF